MKLNQRKNLQAFNYNLHTRHSKNLNIIKFYKFFPVVKVCYWIVKELPSCSKTDQSMKNMLTNLLNNQNLAKV